MIGADGKLTGYGGGIERKRWLLEHEGALPRSLGLAIQPDKEPIATRRSTP